MIDMAVFRATSYTRKPAEAKDSIKYNQNRRGKNGAKIQRTLWGIDGKMERLEAYRMIDEAERRSYFYRLVINLDPEKEDTHKDLYLRELTVKTMLGVEDRVGQSVQWVAATHDDHTPLRHIHIVAVLPRRLERPDLRACIDLSTEIAGEMRRVRDQHRERLEQQKKEGRAWEREKSK